MAQKKDLDIGIEELDKQNVKFGFKSVAIKNAKSFVAVQYNKTLRVLIKMYQKQYAQKTKLS